MPKKSKEEFIKALSDFIGDNTSDDALALLEDAQDSFEGEDVTPYKTEIADLKAKTEEIEKTWRERYKARFTDFTPEVVPTEGAEVSIIDTNETPAAESEITNDEELADLFTERND